MPAQAKTDYGPLFRRAMRIAGSVGLAMLVTHVAEAAGYSELPAHGVGLGVMACVHLIVLGSQD